MPRRPLANMLSASTAEFAQPTAPHDHVRAPRAGTTGGRFSGGRFYGALIVVALVIGALSLLIPSTPSYDPWAWIVWGREIVHVNLHTIGGPSWKPLPMIFTIPFALFGKAAPNLWLVVARAGAFAAVVMVFRLSVRLTRQIGSYFTDAAGNVDRAARLGPPLLAGLIAAVGLTLSGGFISDNALGYSEGLTTAIILIAVERHLDGAPRQAFAIGFLAALDRPEIWLFWGPYGLWLWWTDPGARRLVIGLFVLIPVCWFLPEYWGSGHFLRGVNRAQHPRSNSLAFAHCPFCSELVHAAWPTILLRIKIAAAILVGVVGFVLWRGWRRQGQDALRTPQAIALATAAGAGILGLTWFVVIAIMTQAGFSGNNRYLVIGSALVEICGAVGWGWAAQEIGNRLPAILRRGRHAAGSMVAQASAWSGVAVVAVVFALFPNWVGSNLVSLPRTHRSLVYQADLRRDLTRIVGDYGGAARLLRCGAVMTEGFQVPMVAWTLGVHTLQIQAPPAPGAQVNPPNVILQARDTRHAKLLPVLRSWPSTNYTYVSHVHTFRLFTHCRG